MDTIKYTRYAPFENGKPNSSAHSCYRSRLPLCAKRQMKSECNTLCTLRNTNYVCMYIRKRNVCHASPYSQCSDFFSSLRQYTMPLYIAWTTVQTYNSDDSNNEFHAHKKNTPCHIVSFAQFEYTVYKRIATFEYCIFGNTRHILYLFRWVYVRVFWISLVA